MIGAVENLAPFPGARPRAGAFGAIDELLRDRDAILARIATGTDLAATMRLMVATIAVAMAIVGAAIGSYRGGVQIAFAAIKMPLVLLGTAALSAPALTAIGWAAGRRARLASDLTLVVTALAFGAMLLTAFTPIVLLAVSVPLGYHDMVLVTVLLFSVAGLAALRVIVRGIRIADEAPRGRGSAIVGLCVVFALVGGQLSWALRPYLVRPRTQQLVFVRAVEGSLFDSITTSLDSARGRFSRDAAPLPDDEVSP